MFNNDRTFFDHFTFLAFPVENVFDRFVNELIWVFRMFLGKDFFEFLEWELKWVDFFL
jgi:hypothetical protein